MKIRHLLLAAALAVTPAVALAQTHHDRQQQVEPVPAPSTGYANQNGEAEERHEEGPKPFHFFGPDNGLFNNKEPPFWAFIFNFAILLLIYWRFGKKPVAEALKQRKLSIAAQIENAQKILREAKQRSKRYRGKLEKVEGDAELAKLGKISTGRGEAVELLRAAEEKALRISRDAEFLLEQEKKQTHIDLVRETVERAAREAEELLKKNVSAQDQERLAADFIAQLAKDYEKGLPGGAA
ncbi:MAG TPA: hypothetical protein VGH28_20580 [Polyangiaceae bacterium]|jgi:F-type H+-transporting ATPase subunit b